ncbi:MAG: phosphatase PAP2 family protein [Gammaproteobacteria bacterium]|nr:phosphatase PAP2 family protein [Gammaproteobacteria bacterium]
MSISSKHIIFLVLGLVGSIVLFEYSSLDVQLQQLFYDHTSRQWLVDRDNAILKLLLYDGVKLAYILFVMVLLFNVLFFRKKILVKQYQTGLLIVLLSCVLEPALVGSLKSVTNIPCPRDLTLFDGSYPHVTLLSTYPSSFHQEKSIQCYPAGHASGGFALMSLFFLFRQTRNRVIGLASGFVTGWVTGAYKMLIGDHFLSHTVTTMFLAGLIILILARLLLPTTVTQLPDNR